MRLFSVTVWIIMMAVAGVLPGSYAILAATSPTQERCAAKRDVLLQAHPDASAIIDCEPRQFEAPGRDT